MSLALSACCVLAGPSPAPAQDLDLGPYPVGFRVIEALDSTRAGRPKRDAWGRPTGETARPVRVSLWYPDGVDGPRPAVVHVGDVGAYNRLLPEYLASHGFVVAAYPARGRMTEASLDFSPNALTVDTGIDDTGFVHALLRRQPIVDEERLAVMSFSGSSLIALLWQMRDMQADAVVAVEGWARYRRGVDIVRESVHYDPARVRVPFLMLERAAAEASPAYAKVGDVVDSLRYADIRRVAFRDASHGDFLSHAPSGHTEGQPLIWATAARMVRLFLEETLLDDGSAADSLDRLRPPAAAGADFFTTRLSPGLPAAPSEEELFRLAELDPVEALRVWREASSREPGRPLFREHVLTRAAVFADAPADRAVLMRLVVEAYPSSVAARWRLADALGEAGSPEEARAALMEALRRLPEDPSLDEGARAEWERRIREALREGGATPGGGPP